MIRAPTTVSLACEFDLLFDGTPKFHLQRLERPGVIFGVPYTAALIGDLPQKSTHLYCGWIAES